MDDLLYQIKTIWRAKSYILYFLYAVCFSLAFACVWFFFAIAQNTILSDRLAEEEVLKSEFLTKLAIANKLQGLLKRRSDLESDLFLLEKSVTPVSSIDVLLKDVVSLALARGVRVEAITPKQQQKIQFYTEVPVAVRLVGSYHGAALLMSDLARFSRLLVVEGVRVKSSGETVSKFKQQQVVVDALVKTYVVDAASEK